MFGVVSGIAEGVPKTAIFPLLRTETQEVEIVLVVTDMRLDLSSHSVLLDTCVLPVTKETGPFGEDFFELGTDVFALQMRCSNREMDAWKRLLPAFVERCRDWSHTTNCEYRTSIPVSLEAKQSPLCSCAKGHPSPTFKKHKSVRRFSHFVTRAAISLLWGISYLESVGRDLTLDPGQGDMEPNVNGETGGDPGGSAYQVEYCAGCCRERGIRAGGRWFTCSRCKKVGYCSAECQKKDWPQHKSICKSA
jgi:hypothetical protein